MAQKVERPAQRHKVLGSVVDTLSRLYAPFAFTEQHFMLCTVIELRFFLCTLLLRMAKGHKYEAALCQFVIGLVWPIKVAWNRHISKWTDRYRKYGLIAIVSGQTLVD